MGLSRLLVLLLFCSSWSGMVAAAEDWPLAAERAQAALRRHFWNEQTQVFRSRADQDDAPGKGFDYWWQAHALGAVAAAVGRSSRSWSRDDLSALRDGILRRNGGRWTNDFFDDEGWMTCALLTAAAITGDQAWRVPARLLWDDIHGAWNDAHGGGIPWRKSQRSYKNAPANTPAILIGATFFRLEHHPDDLAQARRIHAWLMATLRDPATDLIWDGIGRTGDDAIDKHWRFTYNQGMAIGACLALHRATGEAAYLDDAQRTGEAALGAFFASPSQLCSEDGKGDSGLFKGILLEHLASLAAASPRLAPRIRALLEANGRRLVELQAGREDALTPGNWVTGRTSSPAELSVHLSGVMLLEALVRLGRSLPAR